MALCEGKQRGNMAHMGSRHNLPWDRSRQIRQRGSWSLSWASVCASVCVCVCLCDDCNRNANRFLNMLRPSVRGDVTTLRSQWIGPIDPLTGATGTGTAASTDLLPWTHLVAIVFFFSLCLPFWRVSITLAVSLPSPAALSPFTSLFALLRHVCNPLCSLLKVKWCAPKLSNFPELSEWVFFAVFPF